MLHLCGMLLCLNMAACSAESYTRVGLLMSAVVSGGEAALDPTFHTPIQTPSSRHTSKRSHF